MWTAVALLVIHFVSWHSYCSCHGLLELTNNMSVHWFLSRSKIWHITQQNVMSCHISSLLKVCLFEMASLIFSFLFRKGNLNGSRLSYLSSRYVVCIFFFWRYLMWFDMKWGTLNKLGQSPYTNYQTNSELLLVQYYVILFVRLFFTVNFSLCLDLCPRKKNRKNSSKWWSEQSNLKGNKRCDIHIMMYLSWCNKKTTFNE